MERTGIRGSWCWFKHIATIFRVEARDCEAQDCQQEDCGKPDRRAHSFPESSHKLPMTLFNFSRISDWRSESLTLLVSLSREMTIYSIWIQHFNRHPWQTQTKRSITSSPHKRSSPCLSFKRSQVWRNCAIPCHLTWSAYGFDWSHWRGVPTASKPMVAVELLRWRGRRRLAD